MSAQEITLGVLGRTRIQVGLHFEIIVLNGSQEGFEHFHGRTESQVGLTQVIQKDGYTVPSRVPQCGNKHLYSGQHLYLSHEI
jgi:hypothetical protein